MEKYLHEEYLHDEVHYQKCKQDWSIAFDRVLLEKDATEQWPVFWNPATVSETGIVWHGLGAILSRVSPRLNRGIIVYMADLETELKEGRIPEQAWVKCSVFKEACETPFTIGPVEFLLVDVVLTVRTFEICRELFAKWVDPHTSDEVMIAYASRLGLEAADFPPSA